MAVTILKASVIAICTTIKAIDNFQDDIISL